MAATAARSRAGTPWAPPADSFRRAAAATASATRPAAAHSAPGGGRTPGRSRGAASGGPRGLQPAGEKPALARPPRVQSDRKEKGEEREGDLACEEPEAGHRPDHQSLTRGLRWRAGAALPKGASHVQTFSSTRGRGSSDTPDRFPSLFSNLGEQKNLENLKQLTVGRNLLQLSSPKTTFKLVNTPAGVRATLIKGQRYRDKATCFSCKGAPGWLSRLGIRPWLRSCFHCKFTPRIGIYPDRSEPGACFRFCLPCSLPLPCSHSVSLTKINSKKKNFVKRKKDPHGHMTVG